MAGLMCFPNALHCYESALIGRATADAELAELKRAKRAANLEL